MSSANVHSIEALESLRGALMRFKGEAQGALNAAAMEIKRTQEWLQERLQYWQNELKRRQRALQEAEAKLSACLAMAAAANLPEVVCSIPQENVLRAQRRVREAEQELYTVQVYIKRVGEVVGIYQQQARRLASTLDNDLLKGAELLSESVAILMSYVAGSTVAGIAGTVGGTIDALSGVSGNAGGSSAGEVNASQGNLQRDGVGYINCSHCGGSGSEEVECNPCGGTGHRFDGSACPHCNGSGVKAIKCWRCEGTGSVLEEMK
jgi:hypothetical protein